jgi:hypothetical protein
VPTAGRVRRCHSASAVVFRFAARARRRSDLAGACARRDPARAAGAARSIRRLVAVSRTDLGAACPACSQDTGTSWMLPITATSGSGGPRRGRRGRGRDRAFIVAELSRMDDGQPPRMFGAGRSAEPVDLAAVDLPRWTPAVVGGDGRGDRRVAGTGRAAGCGSQHGQEVGFAVGSGGAARRGLTENPRIAATRTFGAPSR